MVLPKEPLAWALPIILLLASVVAYIITLKDLGSPQSRFLVNQTLDRTEAVHIPDAQYHDIPQQLDAGSHARRPPQTIAIEINVTSAQRRPDGVLKSVYLINGRFANTVIECRSGDLLITNVHNSLADESLSLHWHGLRTESIMDGSVGVTQCPIKPNQSFTYALQIPEDQAGTFWFYSTEGVQRADGLYGALIVHEPASGASHDDYALDYDDDQVLMIGDWYHDGAQEVLVSRIGSGVGRVDLSPDNIILNGHGYVGCSIARSRVEVDCVDTTIPHLSISKMTTRLRLINTGATTSFSISVSGHLMSVLATDGRRTTTNGTLWSKTVTTIYLGERIDLLVKRLEAAHHNQREWFTIIADTGDLQLVETTLNSVQQFPIMSGPRDERSQSGTSSTIDIIIDQIDLQALVGSGIAESPVHLKAARSIVLYTAVDVTPYGQLRATVNGRTWKTPAYPLLARSRFSWPPTSFPLLQPIRVGEQVDIVINNIGSQGQVFHLHGHEFYVLSLYHPAPLEPASQYNPLFDPVPPASNINLINPLMKDTVHVPAGGYVLPRFTAREVGVWALSSQDLWHQALGLQTVLQVVYKNSTEYVEDDVPLCG